MRRREFIGLIGGATAWPLLAHAEQVGAMRRVGVLVGLTENNSQGQVRVQAFREELAWMDRRPQHSIRLPVAGRKCRGPANRSRRTRRYGSGCHFRWNTTALVAVKKATSTLPIVFAQVSDPLNRGYVASLARRRGNVTGFALYQHVIAGKWVELLAEVAPRTQRIGVIYDPINSAQEFRPVIEKALPPNTQLSSYAVHSRSELEEAIGRIGAEPNGALIILSGPLTAIYRDFVIKLAVKYRLPLVYPYRYFTAAGGLMSYGPDIVDQYRRAAGYVDRILKGEKPSDLPVQFPTKYSLMINLKTAKALGLTILESLLARADEVIE